ncbi:InlB B-repeat-containing protein [Candidatus Saccharibacteria bacterium]|nr:InlB B-repeat-containing protein [Candidatus Saccharibacteria bacterium]
MRERIIRRITISFPPPYPNGGGIHYQEIRNPHRLRSRILDSRNSSCPGTKLHPKSSRKLPRAFTFGALAVFAFTLLFAFSTYLTHSFLYPATSLSAIANGSEIGLNIKDFIKVAVDTDNLALHDASGDTAVTPEPSGTLVYGDVNVAVTTNTVRGYSLSVYTQDSSNSMRHQNSAVTDAIAPISSISGYNATTGASDLAGNTWGFRKNNGTTDSPSYTNWFAVGENANNNTAIYDTDTGNSAFCENLSYPLSSTGCDSGTYDTFNINFGAKLTSSLPAGTYTNNVVFSAVAKDEGARYTLDFHPNGGENVMANRTVIKGSTAVLPTNGFSLPGHAIKGWALTQADAEAASTTTSHPTPTAPTYTTYTAGQTVSVNDLITAAIAAGQSVEQNALINLYAIWDIAYTVTYNAGSNGTNIATGSAITNDTILSATITIPGNENDHFSLEGYNFLGWALTDGATDVVYEASDTVSIRDLISAAATAGQSVTSTASGTINLYGVWEEDIKYMQTFSCTNDLATGETMELVDKRDGSAYNVKKFSDGTCWMTSNLILGHDKGYALTNELTNIPSDDTSTYYFPMAGRRGSLSSASTIESSNTATPTFDGNNENQAHVQYRAQGQGGDDQSSSGATLSQSTGYYNFWAASLGYSGYNQGSSSGNTPRDICPKGWKLPLGGSNTTKSWVSLDKALNGSSAGSNRTDATARDRFLNDASFLYSGYYYSSQLYYVGSDGNWWSSTVYSTNSSYTLYLNSSGIVYPQRYYNNFNYNGFAVRCVAQ